MSTQREDTMRSSVEKDAASSEDGLQLPSPSTSTSEKGEVALTSTSARTGNAAVATPAIQFPEGGMQAWLTVLGGAMVSFCTFGVVQSFGVYQDYYTRVSLKGHSPSTISWIGSVQVFFVFAIGLPAGRLFDAGYFRHCLFCGSLLYTFSIFMLSLVKPGHYYQNFLAQGVGMGLGMGLMFLPSLTLTSHYFRRRRSLAMGLVIAGSSIGACLYPILLNNVFTRASGFGTGVRAVAFMDLGLLIIANLIMKTRLPAKRRSQEDTSIMREIFTDTPYLIFVFGSFLVFWGTFVPFFYLQLYAALHHVDAALVKYALTIMNASSILGRTVPNFIADVYGPINVIIPSSIVTGGLVFALFGATDVPGVVLFAVFYGFFSGGVISVVTPVAGCFVTRADLSDLGIRLGLLSFALSFALLTGNPIAGALLSPPAYKWERPVIFASVIIFAGSICHIFARRALVQRKGTWRT